MRALLVEKIQRFASEVHGGDGPSAYQMPTVAAGQHYLRFAFVPKQGRIDQQRSSCVSNK
jgi:hypothetical protein